MRRRPEKGPADFQKQGRQGSKVNVSPRKVVAGGDEVQFVTEVAVSSIRQHLHAEADERECIGDTHSVC